MKNYNILTVLLMAGALILIPSMMGAQWVEDQKLLPQLSGGIPDGADNDAFGTVFIDGPIAIVGSQWDDDNGEDSGSAYIYEKSGGIWVPVSKLLPLDGAAEDRFGHSVSVSGTMAIVGAIKDDDNGTSSGSAYIFEKTGDVWIQTAKINASDASMDDLFGVSVSISGTTAIVGAYGDDDYGVFTGSAYIFEKTSGNWSQSAKLTSSEADMWESFGYSVSISGNMAIVGAHRSLDNGVQTGSAYIFEMDGGVWSEAVRLNPSDGAEDDFFGRAVSISGNTALIGAYGDDDDGDRSGSAYIFNRNGGNWTESAKLNALDGAAEDLFGTSVSISGNSALIGAFGDSENGLYSGSAYIFEKSNGIWSDGTKIAPSDGGYANYFGQSVAISGSTAIVGGPLATDNGIASGAAYIFEKSDPCAPPTDLDVVEIGFGGPNPRVNATWYDPNGTTDCEVRGGRVAPSSIGTGNPQFANINNTRVITQTDGSTVLFNIVLYKNPNVPFNVGQTYGFEVRCLCEDGTEYTNWSGISPESTFVVPAPPPGLQVESTDKAMLGDQTVVSVFPNPSNGEEINLSITGAELENAFIRIMDMNGKLISESRLDRDVKSGIMNMRFESRLDQGVYMIQVFNQTQMINQRFIVE